MTINMGGVRNISALMRYIKQKNPDMILMQELYGEPRVLLGKEFVDLKWEFETAGDLGVATRFAIKDIDDYAHYMMGVKIQGPDYQFTAYNISLESLSKSLNALNNKGIKGRWTTQDTTAKQYEQSKKALESIEFFENVIIAGDFNMTEINPIYQKYWSKFQNSFSKAGKGFGYSIYSKVHGIRIDHILTDNDFRVISSEVGPFVGGDHRPVLSIVEK
ncbi:MAG: endonuclease/exonuclease/phosphatase family protein [Candidatus Omnitrophota bacterium]